MWKVTAKMWVGAIIVRVLELFDIDIPRIPLYYPPVVPVRHILVRWYRNNS